MASFAPSLTFTSYAPSGTAPASARVAVPASVPSPPMVSVWLLNFSGSQPPPPTAQSEGTGAPPGVHPEPPSATSVLGRTGSAGAVSVAGSEPVPSTVTLPTLPPPPTTSQGVSKTEPSTLVCVNVRTGANDTSPEAFAGTRKSPSYGGSSIGVPAGMSIVNSAPRTVTVPVAPPDMARSRLGMVGTSSSASALVAGDGPSVTLACTLPPGATTAGDSSTVISCGPVASPGPRAARSGRTG